MGKIYSPRNIDAFEYLSGILHYTYIALSLWLLSLATLLPSSKVQGLTKMGLALLGLAFVVPLGVHLPVEK